MNNIILILEKLKTFDEIYLVGGAVRDLLLNLEIKDYDFCCPYTPKQIKRKLKKCGIEKTFDVGEKFGTIGFRIGELNIEITTFRGEQYNYLSRHPEVSYVDSIEEDVIRRDFTINSIYLEREKFNSKQFFNFKDKHRNEAIEDLKNKKIKTVGNPAKRFKEDPLRMLRAIRFSSQLGFSIEDKTFEMIKHMRVNLLNISVERWTQEMDKILSLPTPGLEILGESCLLDIMIPELSYQINFDQNSKYHDFKLWDHTIKVVNATPKENMLLRWAALLHDIGKPFVKTTNKKGGTNYIGHEIMSAHLTEQIGKRLKWPNNRIETVSGMVAHHLEKYCVLKEYDNMSKEI